MLQYNKLNYKTDIYVAREKTQQTTQGDLQNEDF